MRAVAVLSCLPYLALKIAWIAGSHLGIPEGSSLLEHRGAMAAVNGVTVAMDGAVIVLALLLTRPWGMRIPAWLLALPVWVATGLLAPIMAGFPLQLMVEALGGQVGGTTGDGQAPLLDAWVFGVVYTGFIVQGLALGALFVLYARDRWAHLWQGRLGNLPRGTAGAARRRTAVAAAVLAPVPLVGKHVADPAYDVLAAVSVVFLTAAVLGAWALAFRRPRRLPVVVPLALAWTGSGAVACWGAWLSAASLADVGDMAERPTQLMYLTYAGQMIVGVLVATVGARFLAERSAARSRRAV
ncbi:hypothetical protein FNH08_07675 [Streptomyces spongiae]|uniref:Aromatic ring-opening dioxygenase LigA n=1 Tax=Streptomyces spongiae TaxID=565072 RepID=A0A5N8XD66_9ACTN|nr:hypothetical protein [Streptomyces spongiae]